MSATRIHGNAAKVTKWDKKDIIEEVLKKRIKGESYSNLKEYIIHHHGVSIRNAEYYIKDVVKLFREKYNEAITPEEIQLQVAETIGRLEVLYEEADRTSDKLAILKEISELRGLKKGKGGNSSSDTPTIVPIQIIINRDSVSSDSSSAKMISVSRPKKDSNE